MDMSAIASGFVGASQGIERGLQNAYNIDRQGQQDRLALQKYAQDQQYKQQSMQMEQSKYDLQMEQMQLQLKAMKDAQNQTKVFNAFNGYMEDGNPRWFNQTLQENPDIVKLFQGVVRLDPLNPESSEDQKLFQSIGGVDMSDPQVKKRYVKAIDASGNVSIQDIYGLARQTGVYKTWNDEQLKTRHEEATIAELKAKAAYYEGRADGTSAGSIPFDIKTAEYEANLKMKIDDGTASPEETARYNALQSKRGGTGIAISNIAATVDPSVPPPAPGFDISSLQGKAKVETQKHINALELTPGGKDLNSNMKKLYSEGIGASQGLTKQLADLARNKNVTTDIATKFATEAKAFLPEELRDITDKDLEDTKFRQAFMTVSSVYLKLQSGLTVSDAEREDFMKSMGSLSSNIKVNVSGLRNKFSTIVDNYASNRVLNPELYDYKYSKSEMEMRNILTSMDEFLKPTGKEIKPKELTKDKVDLGNKIFFGGN